MIDTFAHRLRQLRKEKGITQESLGYIAGVNRSAVANWEKGIRCPSPIVLRNLAIYFNVKRRQGTTREMLSMSCRVYFDTAPIIYFLENRPQWYDKIESFLYEGIQREFQSKDLKLLAINN